MLIEGVVVVGGIAPGLESIDPVYKDVRFNGTLEFPSVYRGMPSPEVDEAWERLTDGMFCAPSSLSEVRGWVGNGGWGTGNREK